jgi:hypothetical protein
MLPSHLAPRELAFVIAHSRVCVLATAYFSCQRHLLWYSGNVVNGTCELDLVGLLSFLFFVKMVGLFVNLLSRTGSMEAS